MFRFRRLGLSGCAAACLLALAGSAHAAAPYTLTLTVTPTTVALYGTFTISASGTAPKRSNLLVYANASSPCAATAAADRALAGDFVDISHFVTHAYHQDITLHGLLAGAHTACAYLVGRSAAKAPLAAAMAPYMVG